MASNEPNETPLATGTIGSAQKYTNSHWNWSVDAIFSWIIIYVRIQVDVAKVAHPTDIFYEKKNRWESQGWAFEGGYNHIMQVTKILVSHKPP